MIDTADWFHIQWLLLYFVANTQHDGSNLALETACGQLWEELDNIGRQACTYRVFSDKLMKNGMVLQFLKRNLDVVNPCVRIVIGEAYEKMCGSLNQIKMWDCLTSKNRKIGKEYLVHHVSYETLLPYFCSAFYRGSWERPIVFWFLNSAFDHARRHGRRVMNVRQEHVVIVDDDDKGRESLSDAVVNSGIYRKAKSGWTIPKMSKRESRKMRREKKIKEKRAGRQKLKKFTIVHQHATRYSEIEDDSQCYDDDYPDYPDYPDDFSDYSYDDIYPYYYDHYYYYDFISYD